MTRRAADRAGQGGRIPRRSSATTGPDGRALRHIDRAERAATAPDGLRADPVALDTVAVLGSGMMAVGIARELLGAGLSVLLLDDDAADLQRARDHLDRRARIERESGVTCAAEATARLRTGNDIAAAAAAMLAIVACPENPEAEPGMFRTLERHMPAGAILASGSATTDFAAIGAGLNDPSRLLGLHFSIPADRTTLVEIARAPATSDTALATGLALVRRLGKIPVPVRPGKGGIGDRLTARCLEVADMLLMDGTNPWELDEAMEAFGFAMGPYEAQDQVGLDIAYAERRRADAHRDPARRYIPISDRMVQEGRLGRKVGVGWYRYPGGGGKVIDPLLEDLVLEEAYFAKVARRAFSDDEIRERLLLAMINEAAEILRDGTARRASDIDLVSVHGLGFPRARGGLIHYADTLGAAHIVARLQAFAAEDPAEWRISPLLLDAAKTGRKLADCG
ncbi:3-hydroxyacyl-CoA dehydrogenase [Thalassovita aquimarina]|uniref:3-hydroxyacyl-CoA dehydrogenase n=1 Tax=Thalassovita aquimarina TaxID=2785917 RepID=UPI003569F611